MTDKINCFLDETGVLNIKLSGDFKELSSFNEKEYISSLITSKQAKIVKIDGQGIGNWDSSLASLLFKIKEKENKGEVKTEFVNIPKGLDKLINLAFKVDRKVSPITAARFSFFENVGKKALNCYGSFMSAYDFTKDMLKSIFRFVKGQARYRKIDFFFSLEDCSYKAFPIVALISFMVGMILSFVGAVQLKIFGAEIYVASLVMVSMVRVMGALMTGIIIAGRTGASYAATIGTMQVNEEVDALKTMGIEVIDFLLLPRMISLMIMMPLLTVFSDFLGVIGGAFVGVFALGLPLEEYLKASIHALFLNHFLIGIFHGLVFGIIIAMCGCYHGIKCEKDAESVGIATTRAVVSSIVLIIVATAMITISCEVFKL